MQDESDLVGRARQGDQEAFGRLYDEYFDRIYRYIYLKTGSQTEAEDMAQQVFINAFQSIASFRLRENTPFSAWLFRIAHNQVVDHLRRRVRRPTTVLDEAITAGSLDDPAQTAEQTLDIEHLSAALAKLTPAQQEVISLRFTSGLSLAEVAGIMGRSVGAVKALQHSAVASLRRELAWGEQ